MGWALIRGWALINFFCLWDGRLFELGANSRLGAYSNKYGIFPTVKSDLLLSVVQILQCSNSGFDRYLCNKIGTLFSFPFGCSETVR